MTNFVFHAVRKLLIVQKKLTVLVGLDAPTALSTFNYKKQRLEQQ